MAVPIRRSARSALIVVGVFAAGGALAGWHGLDRAWSIRYRSDQTGLPQPEWFESFRAVAGIGAYALFAAALGMVTALLAGAAVGTRMRLLAAAVPAWTATHWIASALANGPVGHLVRFRFLRGLGGKVLYTPTGVEFVAPPEAPTAVLLGLSIIEALLFLGIIAVAVRGRSVFGQASRRGALRGAALGALAGAVGIAAGAPFEPAPGGWHDVFHRALEMGPDWTIDGLWAVAVHWGVNISAFAAVGGCIGMVRGAESGEPVDAPAATVESRTADTAVAHAATRVE